MTPIHLPAGIDLAALSALAADKHRQTATAREERPDGLVPAVSYLRVSTKDQATRNGLEEGLSIPAQREAAQRKAEQLGAVIVKEFIESGESAKTARRRALQEMLDYIAANPVQLCIINKVDRLARNRLDDAIIHATLRGANITLVSVTENIDESPSGMLMHGILASMAEFYSLNLAQEVLKGMTQKASIGGTPTKAPLGYLNVRTTDAKGREVRDVEPDPDRAELIRFAFTAYATGDWSLSSLARELKTRGLTTRSTPSQPAKPVTTTGLHKVLTNPYYQGTVTFRGVTYEGAHTPLVDTDTWLRVQTQLDAKNAVGERPQKYDHYLKGTVHCSCGTKLMIERPRDKQGDRYEYFTCSGRRKKNGCTRSAILAERIEDRIERDYCTNGLTGEEAQRVSQVLHQVFNQLEASSDDERAVLTAQRDKLEAERLKLVQAHYADAIPLDLLKTEQDRIHTSLDAITHRLDSLANTYHNAHDGLDQILGLLTDLGDLYSKCEPSERRILNRALFKRIIIDEDEHLTFVPTEPAAAVLARTHGGEAIQSEPETNLPRHQAGQVSNFSIYVELRGFEPLTLSLRTLGMVVVWGLLRWLMAGKGLTRTMRTGSVAVLCCCTRTGILICVWAGRHSSPVPLITAASGRSEGCQGWRSHRVATSRCFAVPGLGRLGVVWRKIVTPLTLVVEAGRLRHEGDGIDPHRVAVARGRPARVGLRVSMARIRRRRIRGSLC